MLGAVTRSLIAERGVTWRPSRFVPCHCLVWRVKVAAAAASAAAAAADDDDCGVYRGTCRRPIILTSLLLPRG